MHRLVYTSTQAVPLKSSDFERLCAQASVNNQTLGLTGILLFNGREFLQCLEGAQEQISTLFKSIALDSRHRDIQIHRFGAVSERWFEGWGMQGVNVGPGRDVSSPKTAFDYLDSRLNRSWQSLGAGAENLIMEYGRVKAEVEQAPHTGAFRF